MTHVEQRNDQRIGGGPLPAPRLVRERRVRPVQAAAALLLVLAGAVGSAMLVSAAAADGSYVVIAADVPYGRQVTGADLTTVQLGSAPGVEMIAAEEMGRLVGMYAAVPLLRGSLLTPAMLTSDPIPGPGQHVVGVTLRGDRVPAQRPAPGDHVLLVSTISPDAPVEGVRAGQWEATVTAVSTQDAGPLGAGDAANGVTLDVAVPAGQSTALARAAAAGELVVVLTGGG